MRKTTISQIISKWGRGLQSWRCHICSCSSFL